MRELLAALEDLVDTQLIFTLPNADTDGRELFEAIEGFVRTHSNAKAFTSLGQLRYLSCIKHVDGVVGNSSSGLVEAPSFRKGAVNIGDRQLGRLRAKSVIDCSPDRRAIKSALERLYSRDFQTVLRTVTNPYGDGGASEKVVNVLKDISLDDLLKKRFYDLSGICA
jgi:GDP/UDP-N,N'-diacetylbacillosamine 2-epimerase (hydrolysing)